MTLIDRLYERHCQGDDLCGEAQREIERLRDALEDIAGYTGRSWAKDKAIKALGYDYE